MRVFAVDKPLIFSSHDVVARARRLLGTRRVGHAGTLDPLATGVLVLLIDEATKLAPFLSGADKAYLAWIALGVGSTTLDAEAPVLERADASALDEPAIREALLPFLALREQRPPAHSAVQRSGQRAYAAARRGEPLDLPPRPVGYFELELLALTPAGTPPPERLTRDADGWRPARTSEDGVPLTLPAPLAPAPWALVRLRVAAGTYVRALARDLGEALGVPAHLAGLVRTSAGEVDLSHCVSLDALPEAAPLDPVELLPFPRISLDEERTRAVRDGQRLPVDWSGRAALLAPDGSLAAIADAVDGRLRLVRVWR